MAVENALVVVHLTGIGVEVECPGGATRLGGGDALRVRARGAGAAHSVREVDRRELDDLGDLDVDAVVDGVVIPDGEHVALEVADPSRAADLTTQVLVEE